MDAKNLNDFLFNHKTKKGERYTHTRIAGKENGKTIYGGCYCIEGDDLLEFHKLYLNVIKSGGKEYLTEKPLKQSLFNFDFDFRYDTNIDKRQHNQEHIHYIVYGIAEGIKKICNETPNNYEIIVLEKDNVIKEETKTKDGIHVLVELRANSDEKLEVRDYLMYYLKEHDTFKNLPLTNDMNDIVDKRVLKDDQQWMMLYSQKPNNIPYKITNIYNVENNNDNIELDPLDIDSYNKEELFYKWTIQNTQPPIIKTNIVPKETNKKEVEKKTYEKADDETIKKLIECLKDKRAEDSDEWRIIGACIYNEKGDDGLPYFIEFSRKSKNHNDSDEDLKDLYYDKIAKYANHYNYTLGTIKYYAKMDNYNKYMEITNRFQYCENWDPYDWALYLSDELKYRLKYSLNNWFICIDKLWKRVESPTYLCVGEANKLIELNMNRTNYSLEEDEDVIKEKEKLLKKLKSLKSRIDTPSFSSQLKEHLKHLCIDNDFINKLYSHQEKLIFKNGILDMRTGLLSNKEIVGEDYIAEDFIIDWEFKNDVNEENKKFIKEKLLQIHNNNQEQLDWILKVYGYALSGIMTEQIMVNIKGLSAGNGKSTITETLVKVLPSLVKLLPSEILNLNYTKRHKFLGDICGKRILQFEELPKDKKIDTQFIKNFTSGLLQVEILFGTNKDMNVNATIFSNTNHTPNLDVDEGLKRRYKECETKNKFYSKDDYEKLKVKKPTDYLADNNLRDKLISMKNEFIHILLEGYRDYLKEGKLKEPLFITENIKETMGVNNVICDIFDENFLITNNKTDIISKREFCQICKIENDRDFTDFRKLRGLSYDCTKRKNGFRGYLFGIVRQYNNDDDSDDE